MTTRLGEAFSSAGRPLLVACLVAGDPSPEATPALMRAAAAAGADAIELVMPHSDPVADGPVMQRAMQRALSAGTTPDTLFAIVQEFRAGSEVPVVILTYANIPVQRGIGTFYRDAARAGADAVAVADVPLEEAGPFCRAAREAGVDPVLFASVTTSGDRLRRIAACAGGFLYLVSVLGVTGVREGVDPRIPRLVGEAKAVSGIPVVAGFGIGAPAHVRAFAEAGVDGVIVGSAIVAEVERTLGDPDLVAGAVGAKVSELARALGDQPPG
ncbi:MAG: tryptophan synthase subunit alpha [Methanolinea sp.]|nr:tryptophan synthase subunit alpha [Methanolinea sp.]